MHDLTHVMAALRGIADKIDKMESKLLELQAKLDDCLAMDMDEEEDGETLGSHDTTDGSDDDDESYDSSFIDDGTESSEGLHVN